MDRVPSGYDADGPIVFSTVRRDGCGGAKEEKVNRFTLPRAILEGDKGFPIDLRGIVELSGIGVGEVSHEIAAGFGVFQPPKAGYVWLGKGGFEVATFELCLETIFTAVHVQPTAKKSIQRAFEAGKSQFTLYRSSGAKDLLLLALSHACHHVCVFFFAGLLIDIHHFSWLRRRGRRAGGRR